MSNFVWGLGAVILAVTAQAWLLLDRAREAGMLYAAAVVLIVYALRRQAGPERPSVPVREDSPRPIHYRSALALFGTAGLLGALSLWQFTSEPVPVSAWLLHIGSLVLLIAGAFLPDKGRGQMLGERTWSRAEMGLLISILALAAILRLAGLDQLPFGTWYDEAQYGLTALHILEDSTSRPVYLPRFTLAGHYLYLVVASFWLFGASTAALRMVSALMGIGAVAAGYLTGRELFGRRMGLVLAFLLAVSRWHINFSRIGMENASTPLFELVTIGFLLRGIRRQRLSDFAWAGMAMGLGMVFYTGFLSFPLVLAFFLAHSSLVERNFFRRFWRGLLVFGVAVLLTVGPVAQYAIRSPEEFWSRTQKTSVFAGKTRAQAWEAVRGSAGKHLLMFNYRGDRYGRHNLPGEPMLDPVSGALMVLGVGVCLWRGRRPRSLLLLVWLGVMLCPGIFSLEWEAPHALRAIGSLPAAYLLAVVPIDGLWREWERGVPQRYARYFVLLVVLLLVRIGYTNYHIYFERQATDFGTWRDFSTPETITARIMRDLGESVELYVTSLYHSHPTVRFLAPHVTEYHRIETHDSLPLPQTTDKDVVLILDPERFHLYEEAQRYYPGAAFVEYKSPFGGP
ncbi:MAG: glycosyltransferase family 39 protein, partial [Anaerolineae bacterium]